MTQFDLNKLIKSVEYLLSIFNSPTNSKEKVNFKYLVEAARDLRTLSAAVDEYLIESARKSYD